MRLIVATGTAPRSALLSLLRRRDPRATLVDGPAIWRAVRPRVPWTDVDLLLHGVVRGLLPAETIAVVLGAASSPAWDSIPTWESFAESIGADLEWLDLSSAEIRRELQCIRRPSVELQGQMRLPIEESTSFDSP